MFETTNQMGFIILRHSTFMNVKPGMMTRGWFNGVSLQQQVGHHLLNTWKVKCNRVLRWSYPIYIDISGHVDPEFQCISQKKKQHSRTWFHSISLFHHTSDHGAHHVGPPLHTSPPLLGLPRPGASGCKLSFVSHCLPNMLPLPMWFVHLIHLESLGKSILSSLRFTLYQLVPWLNLWDFHLLLAVSMSKYVKCCTLPDAAYHTSDAPAHRSCYLHQPEQKWMDREMSRNMVEGTSQVVEWKSHRSGIWILYIWNNLDTIHMKSSKEV